MSHRDAPAICRKIDAALDVIGNEEDELRPYLIWQLEEFMGGDQNITLDDCTTAELMSLGALLAPVFSRRLSGLAAPVSPHMEGAGKRLTLIRSADGTTGA